MHWKKARWRQSIVCLHNILKFLFGHFPHGSGVKNPPCNAGDMGLISGQGTKIPRVLSKLAHAPWWKILEQSYGLCGRGRGWEDLGEWHWNMLNIMYEMSCQSRFDARYWLLGASALGRPRGMVWGGRREEGSGWGTHVYLWRIHFDVWQN